MEYGIYGALITLKNTGAITKEKFIEEWRCNQKRMGIVPMPSTAYLLGPRRTINLFQKLKWRLGKGF